MTGSTPKGRKKMRSSAVCSCGWQIGPWPGKFASRLVAFLFHRHMNKCEAT